MSQMACKDNAGDFHKAVVMSGMFKNPYVENPFFIPRSLEDAGKLGEQLFEALGVKTLEEARKLDAQFIRRTYSDLRNKTGVMFTIVNDGHFCTEDPLDAFRNGTRNRVPVMAGNTGDEFFEFIRSQDEEQLKILAKEYFGDKAEEFLSYPEAHIKTDAGYAPVSAPEMGVKTAFLAESAMADTKPCYYYRFVPDIPGDDHPGTFHSVDLWFFFETLAKCIRPFEGRHYDIARQMCDYWANFIKTGDPNGYDINGNKLPEWRCYTDSDRAEMEFTPDGAAETRENSAFTKFLLENIK